jgi:Tol biopolymer transport system component
MSYQSNEPNDTLLINPAREEPASGQRQPPNRTPLIIGALGGCIVLILLLACLGGAAWYFLAGPGANQQVATPALPTPRPTSPIVATKVVVPTEKPTEAAATEEPTATEGAAAAGALAYVVEVGDNSDVYILDPAQPGGSQNLTADNPGGDTSPTWSPDGAKIVFSSLRDGNEALQIYVMDADGANVTQLSHEPDGARHPQFSPDGQRIAYVHTISGTLEIAVMQADGSDPHQIAAGDPNNYYPRWSPDGQQIAFLSTRNGSASGTAELYVIGAESGSARRLLPDLMNVQRFNWSPNGLQLIFAAKPTGDVFQIYVVNLDGTGLTKLTDTTTNEIFPAYSPDGQSIVFVSDRTGNNNLFQMAADGSNQTQLTDTTDDNKEPAWRPGP